MNVPLNKKITCTYGWEYAYTHKIFLKTLVQNRHIFK